MDFIIVLFKKKKYFMRLLHIFHLFMFKLNDILPIQLINSRMPSERGIIHLKRYTTNKITLIQMMCELESTSFASKYNIWLK